MSKTTRRQGICPYCGSDEIEFEEADVGSVFRESYLCTSCDKHFYEIWEFVYSHSVGYEPEE